MTGSSHHGVSPRVRASAPVRFAAAWALVAASIAVASHAETAPGSAVTFQSGQVSMPGRLIAGKGQRVVVTVVLAGGDASVPESIGPKTIQPGDRIVVDFGSCAAAIQIRAPEPVETTLSGKLQAAVTSPTTVTLTYAGSGEAVPAGTSIAVRMLVTADGGMLPECGLERRPEPRLCNASVSFARANEPIAWISKVAPLAIGCGEDLWKGREAARAK